MAQQEILQERNIAPDENIVHQIAILPDTNPEQLAKDIELHIGYPMILYNGEAEHGKGSHVPDYIFFRMMESPFPHVMRSDVAEDVAHTILSRNTTRIVFTDPHSQ